MPNSALERDIDNIHEANAPVQTPVTGKGIAIKRTNPNSLYLLIVSSLLSVLFKMGLIIKENKRWESK